MDVMESVDLEDVEDEDEQKRTFHKELWFLLIVALALALLMKTLLIQAFFIPSGSMERTLHGCPGCSGDRVLVNKLVYRFRDIHRGEVVVFNGKGTNFTPEFNAPPKPTGIRGVAEKARGWLGFGQPGEKDFIKRVIGIGGDTVACCTHGHVTVNGQELTEPYVCIDTAEPPPDDCSGPQDEFDPVLVPDGHLFVMGDHRNASSDSRYNGTIPETVVVGRAFAVFWPPKRVKVLGVPTDTFAAPGGAAAAPYVLGFATATPITVVRRRLRRTT